MEDARKDALYYLPIYAGALAFIAVLVIATHVTIDRIAAEQQFSGRVIEMASRQRMLSQRVASLTLDFTSQRDLAERRSIRGLIEDAHARMMETHLALTRGELINQVSSETFDAVERIYYEEPHFLDNRVRLFLYDTREVLGKAWTEDLERNVYVRQIVEQSRRALLASLQDATDELVADGAMRVADLRATLRIMHGAVIVAVIAVAVFVFNPLFRKIVSQRKELMNQARLDALTGALNRRSFDMLMETEFERARRYEGALSVMLIDIDHFKVINDTFGHAAGDRVLKDLVTTCRGTLRRSDSLARVGGEEFAVVLPGTTLDQAVVAAEKLREILAHTHVAYQGGSVSFTVSIGVAEVERADESAATMIGRADACLYGAKHAGRNRVKSTTAADSAAVAADPVPFVTATRLGIDGGSPGTASGAKA